MPDTIQSIKVNGTSYKIDYESLENLPFYYTETPGAYLLEDESITISENSATITLDAAVTEGEGLEITLKNSGAVTFTDLAICHVGALEGGARYVAQSDFTRLCWTQAGEQFDSCELKLLLDTPPQADTISVRRVTIAAGLPSKKAIVPVLRENVPTKGLSVMDLAGAVIACDSGSGPEYCTVSSVASLESTGAPGIVMFFTSTMGEPYAALYNPESGYLFAFTADQIEAVAGAAMTTYDASETATLSGEETAASFVGAFLKYGDGEKCLIRYASQARNGWLLTPCEPFLKDANGVVAAKGRTFGVPASGIQLNSDGTWSLSAPVAEIGR